MTLQRRRLLQLAGLSALASAAPRAAAAQGGQGPKVLTGLQATYSIASALCAGTPVEVINLPANGAPLEGLARALERLPADAFAGAAATVGIGRLWPADPLYPAARAVELGVINIDAAFPWGGDETGVSVLTAPAERTSWSAPPEAAGGDPSPYAWLSLTNGVRMAELAAADLARLSPPHAEAILANLDRFTAGLRDMKSATEDRFAAVEDGRVFSLADEFVYLFAELGLDVEGWFARPDIEWTAQDLAGLQDQLKAGGVRVVAHKWTPDARIVDAIAAGGAKLVVLDPGGAQKPQALDPAGYQQLMGSNAEALAAALSAS